MHILLTDILRCPRCGPEFGLVLLADHLEDRRVQEGRLGCANCRESFSIHKGEPDLRLAGLERLSLSQNTPPEAERAVRVAALLGLAQAQGIVLLIGWGAALAPEVAALVPEIDVLSASGGRVGGEPPARVHPVAASAPLPFASGAFRGVALASGSDALAEEGARVLGPSGRILVEGAPPGVAGRLEALGLCLLLDSEGAVVAERR